MPSHVEIVLVDRITGVLIGTAVGDSLGLPMERISKHRVPNVSESK